MRFLTQSLQVCTIFFIAILYALPAYSAGKGKNPGSTTATIDFNEETHLVFMREEEKLAHDVYSELGALYPDVIAFQNIIKAEEQHTNTVKEKLIKYDIEDPSISDKVGEFTGDDYGEYFTAKFGELMADGEEGDLAALYVGAKIEELDMLDIVECPKVIREMYSLGTGDCGLNYTDNSELQNMLGALLEGSKNHLRSFVGHIEAIQGKCTYEKQVLTQLEVDTILGRVGECGFDYDAE